MAAPECFKATFRTTDGRHHEWTVPVRRWAWARKAFFEDVGATIPVETIMPGSVCLAPVRTP
jgi:hypothetical protein